MIDELFEAVKNIGVSSVALCYICVYRVPLTMLSPARVFHWVRCRLSEYGRLASSLCVLSALKTMGTLGICW